MTETRIGAAATCRRCEAPLVEGRFCLNCGARTDGSGTPPDGSSEAMTPIPEASPEASPDPEPRPDRAPNKRSPGRRAWRGAVRWRSPLVIVPLLAALGLAGSIGAEMLWAEIPRPLAKPDSVRCWDGPIETDPDACTEPTGVNGLAWVFPLFTPSEVECDDVLVEHPDYQRPTMWECVIEADGEEISLTYSELTSVAEGLDFISREYDGFERKEIVAKNGDPVRYEWRRPVKDGFTMTSMYVGFPYAVEVRAEKKKIREWALETLVRFRSTAAISYR